MKNVYIVLPTYTIGGAEKRFVQLWIYLQKTNIEYNVNLVIYKKLYNKLIILDEFSDISKYKNGIEFLKWKGIKYFDFILSINEWSSNKKESIIHFVLSYPIILKKTNKMIYTYPGNNLNDSNLKGQISNYLGFLHCNKIDVLNPNIADELKRKLPFIKNKINTTPSSCIDLEHYKSINFDRKKNWLVFLGRFVEIKQTIELLNSIPMINKSLLKNNISDIKFFFLGEGSLENEMKKTLLDKSFENIDITIRFEENPVKILSQSKVFFSLQKYSNYPSKSLQEALASGNLPIVTDNGDTRLLAKEDFSYYVNENFAANKLAENCIKILELNEISYLNKVDKARAFLKSNFSLEKSANYFKELYEKI